MNREEHLMKTFPLEDGTTYIQNIDKANEPKGAGVGGESLKENFIDSMKNIKNILIKKILLMISYALISIIGGLAVVFGEIDDSPGLGGIGLILIIISAVGTYKVVKRK